MKLRGSLWLRLVAVLCMAAVVAARTYAYSDWLGVQGCSTCIPLYECPAMVRLLESGTYANAIIVQDAICGYDQYDYMVCCPTDESSVVSPPPPPTQPDDVSPLPTSCGFSKGLNRVFGGSDTALGAYPWMAAMVYQRGSSVQLNCGGTLISSRYVLTAAHCVAGKRASSFKIRLGEWDFSRKSDCEEGKDGKHCAPPAKTVAVESVVVHPTYGRRFEHSDDIALIRLAENLDLESLYPNIAPVCLQAASSPAAAGDKVLAVGWGTTENGHNSAILQQVELPIVEPERCQAIYQEAFQDGQICAGGVEGEDTCYGDSGGPLLTRGPPFHQVGIVSFGFACARKNIPAVYTSVTDHEQWIMNNMKP